MTMATTAPSAAASVPQDTPAGPVYVDTQHEDLVHDAKLDYYGCKLATASSDRTVKIFNVSGSSHVLSATLHGHEGPVWQVSWAHPSFGVVLASCSFDGSVLIHRETRPHEWTLFYAARQIHESSVNCVAFAPHEFGLMLASASSDGKVSVLAHQLDGSWSTVYLRDNALGVNSVSWAPYGAYYDQTNPEAIEPPRLVTGGCDNRIRFWVQSTTGEWVEDTESRISDELSHSDWVRDVAWAPSILPNVNVVASCSEDKTVLIWTQNGRGQEWKPTLLRTFDSPVWRVSWSVTGHMLAVSSGDNDVSIWKAGLDGTWTQMGTIDDAANSSAQPQG